ncbi:universal stress protein [Desulfogranum mediterraneum]|uniref:universal stress protein n=1 Tax=Desulfogranum mediterraneum TaxID=160661 RepID=UPI000407268E|nr:universal stress protein [Desulfogranum mediterraneum]
MDWKRIIIAIDNSPVSVNAVKYVASIAGNLSGVNICLLHIYPVPPPDYYRQGDTLQHYRQRQEEAAASYLAEATDKLQQAGVPAEAIDSRCLMAEDTTISQAILRLQQEERYGTIVVGKRGISKSEEFLFGSISSALIHHAKDTAVWVVG